MAILVAGGAGYIGSHICVELLNENEKVVIVDNLSNSSPVVVEKIREITNKDLKLYEADINDLQKMDEIFENEDIEAVIHLAGYKAVGESVEKPLEYYQNNIGGSLNLCSIMKKHNVKNIIFSSSATVYGDPDEMPIKETTPKGVCTNPYAWTKWMIEQILQDLWTADKDWNVVILRYFNPVGAHSSGLIGESPNGIPNNLTPYITQVAIGKLEKLRVFGDDYQTPDGTGVRDYIHVVDLAKGHVCSLDKIRNNNGYSVYNLGTGKGSSVLEMLSGFEKAVGKKIPYEIVDRRSGDIATSYCDASLAKKELNWQAELTLDDMCNDAWNWQVKNPNGYEK